MFFFISQFILLAVLFFAPFLGAWEDRFAAPFIAFAVGTAALFIGLADFFSGGIRFSRRILENAWKEPAAWALVFVAALIVATAASDARLLATKSLFAYFGGVTAFFAARRLLRSRTAQEILSAGLLGVTCAVVLVGLWRYFQSSALYGFTSTLSLPGPAASWFLLTAPLALAFFIREENRMRRIIFGVLSVLFLAALFLTGVRGGFLVAVVVAVPFFIFSARFFGMRQGFFAPATLAAVALVLAGILSALQGFSARQGSLAVFPSNASFDVIDENTEVRFVFWEGAARMFLERPLTGWGPGTFGSLWPHWQPDPTTFTRSPHSTPLEILAETGFAGALSYAGFLAALFFSLFRRHIRKDASPLAFGLAFGLLGAFLHTFGDIDWRAPSIFITFWIVAGLLDGTVDAGASGEFAWLKKFSVARVAQLQKIFGNIVLPSFRSSKKSFAVFFFAIPWLLAGFLILGAALGDLRAEVLRAHTAAFVSRGQFVAAATLAEQAGTISRSPSDFLRAGSWLLVMPASDEERAALAQRAVNDAQRAQALDPFDADGFGLEGEAHARTGNFLGAGKAYEEALARDPMNHPGYALGLAGAHVREGDYGKAEDALDVMLARYDKKAIVHYAGWARNMRGAGLTGGGPIDTIIALSQLSEFKAALRERAGDVDAAARWRAQSEELRALLAVSP